MKKKVSSEQGFAAVTAIFLIVIVAALGAFMLTFSNTQQLTSAQDIKGSRAYWAARAGLEWGVASVLNTSVCPTLPTPSPTELQIENHKVILRCERYTYSEATQSVNIFEFTSVASPIGAGAVGSLGYIERSVSASIER